MKLPPEIAFTEEDSGEWRWDCAICGKSGQSHRHPSGNIAMPAFGMYRAATHVIEEHWPLTWFVTECDDPAAVYGAYYTIYADTWFPDAS